MPNRLIRDVVGDQVLVTVSGRTTVFEAAKKMAAARIGALLVVDGGRVTGIFTERDALNRVLATGVDAATTQVESVMTRDPQTVHPDKPLGHAMHMMYEGGFRHVPVVEDGKPLGMVSARDALGPEMVAFEKDLQQRTGLTERL